MQSGPGVGDSILERVRAEVEAMPQGSLLPRDWVLERLSKPGDAGPPAEGVSRPPSIDLTVEDLGSLFGRSPSTVRAWVERGDFPEAYKLHGREWRIPVASLRAFQERQQQRAELRSPPRPEHRLSDWRKVKRQESR